MITKNPQFLSILPRIQATFPTVIGKSFLQNFMGIGLKLWTFYYLVFFIWASVIFFNQSVSLLKAFQSLKMLSTNVVTYTSLIDYYTCNIKGRSQLVAAHP